MEDTPSQQPQENDTFDRAPLNSVELDSDSWDSDFSLHVQPLSDLSELSSDEPHWETGTQGKATRPNTEERTRKKSDKTTTNVVRRKESKRGPDTEAGKGPITEGAVGDGARRSITGEDHVRDSKSKRKPVVKPIPRIGPGTNCAIDVLSTIVFELSNLWQDKILRALWLVQNHLP